MEKSDVRSTVADGGKPGLRNGAAEKTARGRSTVLRQEHEFDVVALLTTVNRTHERVATKCMPCGRACWTFRLQRLACHS